MFNRLFLILLLFIGLVSCDKIIHNNNTDTSQTKLEPIDFSSIDAYPLLPECEQIDSRELQKQCFYKFLSKRIALNLSKKNITLTSNFIDTIQVKINVSSKGIISVKSINISDDNQFKELKRAIIQSVATLPQIQPAIKAGIPVTSEYILPIVLKPNR